VSRFTHIQNVTYERVFISHLMIFRTFQGKPLHHWRKSSWNSGGCRKPGWGEEWGPSGGFREEASSQKKNFSLELACLGEF